MVSRYPMIRYPLTDRVIERAEEWQNRPLKKFYTFLFMDYLYVPIRKEMGTKNLAVYILIPHGTPHDADYKYKNQFQRGCHPGCKALLLQMTY